MAFVTRRKTAAAALVVVGIAGLSIASAAQLNLNSASLGAGETVVAACQTTGAITVGFENEFAGGAYQTTGVTLTGIHEDCEGLNYKVTLLEGETSLVEAEGTEITGDTVTIALDPAVAAAEVTGVAVVIFG